LVLFMTAVVTDGPLSCTFLHHFFFAKLSLVLFMTAVVTDGPLSCEF
jgi:hypothetical protein